MEAISRSLGAIDDPAEAEVAPFVLEEPLDPPSVDPSEASWFLREVPPLDVREHDTRAPAAVVRALDALPPVIRAAPLAAVEAVFLSRDAERWVREVVGDETLARDLAALRATTRTGEPLRTLLFTLIGSRVAELRSSAATVQGGSV